MSAPASPRPVFIPGGVADAAGRVGYLAAEGGIVALDLAAGRTLWRSGEAFLPVLATGDALAAAAEDGQSVRLLLLDAGSGAPRLSSDPLSPAAPVWGVTDARLEDGRLLVSWRGAELPRGTPPDPSSRWNGPLAAGSARVELATGRVEPLPAAPGGAAPGALPGADDGGLLPDFSGTVRRWEAGGVVAGVALEDAGGGARLVLRRWSPDTGEALPAVVLADPAPPRESLAHFRFPDPRHVFLRTGAAGEASRWRIFSAETGAPVADLALPGAEEGMAVVGGRLFHVAPGSGAAPPGHRARALRAVDPGTGAVLWEHPLEPAQTTPSRLAQAEP